MRCVLTFFLCCFLAIQLKGQKVPEKWNHLIGSEESASFFLVKNDQFERTDFRIAKRLDSDYSIIYAENSLNIYQNQMIPVKDDWKLNVRRPSLEKNGIFYISTRPDFDLQFGDDLELISKYSSNLYVVAGNFSLIKERLLSSPAVLYISDEGSKPHTEARVIDMNINPNRVNKIHHSHPDLDGSGRTVSIKENQYDLNDLDIRGRNVPSALGSEVVDNHATEMATIIAGNGNSFVTGRGVATRANITSSDFAVTLPDDAVEYLNLNVQTQNHSYGTLIESFYGAQAAAFDQSAFDNHNLLHVFSSGNQGEEASTEGTYAGLSGFSNLTGNFKMAKNALVVGSVDTVGNVVPFSSRGPAFDGRVKPELVAYSVAGSSNSAALVSGVSVLLQQEYEATIGTELPSALLKALLINAAIDVANPGLDHSTGYGSVDAFRSLETLKSGQYITGTVSTGASNQHAVVVPANAVNLRATLCWTDPPAAAGSFKALVNDLDLKLIDGSLNETLPWTLNIDANATSLSAQATRNVDRINNVEQVTLDVVSDTDYIIEVTGFDVAGSQEYHIVYQYDLEESFDWDYPTASDNMPYNGESGSYFRWKSTLSEGEGVLEYSTDNGESWSYLDDVDLSTGHWRWDEIPDLHTTALARMRVGGDVFETDSFTISRPTRVSVGFNCADSTLLQWNGIQGISRYDLYTVGEQELVFFESAADTFLIIPDTSELSDNHFSIRPILANEKEVIPSETLDYTRQAGTCFLLSFFQEVALDTGIYLNLSLGTTYGIDQVHFQRKVDDVFVAVETLIDLSTNEIRILDTDPNQGLNEHRAVIDFTNGQQISEIASNTFYLTEIPLILFPNPIVSASEINLLTKDFGADVLVFRLFDSKGIEVVRKELVSTLETISIFNLPAGIYHYRLEASSAKVNVGKLIVR